MSRDAFELDVLASLPRRLPRPQHSLRERVRLKMDPTHFSRCSCTLSTMPHRVRGQSQRKTLTLTTGLQIFLFGDEMNRPNVIHNFGFGFTDVRAPRLLSGEQGTQPHLHHVPFDALLLPHEETSGPPLQHVITCRTLPDRWAPSNSP